MPKHRSGAIDYSQRLKAIRPFVSFNYDLRKPLASAQKAKINKYYDYIQKLTIRPHQVFRARTDKKLRAVQRFAQHDSHHRELRVAFVPNAGSERMRISVTKRGEVRGRTGHIRVFEIPLDHMKLVTEGRSYIQRKINEGPDVQRYVIQAGAFENVGAYAKPFIVDEVLKKMERYGSDKYDADDPNSHYFGNWLFGLNGYRFRRQEELMAYREARRQAAKKKAREYVTQRRRQQRQAKREPDYWLNDATKSAKRDYPPQPHPWRKVGPREYFRHVFDLGYTETKGA